jgi:hypothetical protein
MHSERLASRMLFRPPRATFHNTALGAGHRNRSVGGRSDHLRYRVVARERRAMDRTKVSIANQAEHVCGQLNRRRPGGHPGYILQERDTSKSGYDGNVEC